MSLSLLALLFLSAHISGVDSRLSSDLSVADRRTLLQDRLNTEAKVSVVEFRTLLDRAGAAILDEEELKGRINVTLESDKPVLFGAYHLWPSQVAQIDHTVATELAFIPAANATLAPILRYPGRQLMGMSVLRVFANKQPKRIPTVFAPFHSGYKFELQGTQDPPGTTLHFSNITFMVANATYDSLATSGVMSYFKLGTSARLCISNSMFVLQSCKGFIPKSFHMWCCTRSQCDVEYTEQALQDLGYPLKGPLEFLTCHDLGRDAQTTQPSASSIEDGNATSDAGVTMPRWAVATAGGSAAFLLVAVSGMLLFFRSDRLRSRAAPVYVHGSATPLALEPHMHDTSMHAQTISDSNVSKESSTQLIAMRSVFSKSGADRPGSLPHVLPHVMPVIPSNAQPDPDHPLGFSLERQFSDQAAELNTKTISRQWSTLQDAYAAAYPTKSTAETTSTVSIPIPNIPMPSVHGANKASIQEYIQYQIDTLDGREVLDGLVLQQGLHSRLLGGQAVVQMAKDRSSNLEYAIKFYVSRAAFEDEAALYAAPSSPLGQFLPAVRDMQSNEDGTFLDAHGAPMPPCISMEKGESLDLWSARNGDGVDMITALQVIHHIAERLEDLHDAGYCHRDLKPGNVMWLPRRNRWTLIDFGCAAHTGEDARLAFSLAYAAPEVIHAVRAGQSTMMASDKLDAWSLGVMAVELLTNEPAYPSVLVHGREKVMDMIAGVGELPWEAAETAPGLLRRFGHFRVAVMGLLQRNPADRPSMAAFRKQCKRVLMQTTTTL